MINVYTQNVVCGWMKHPFLAFLYTFSANARSPLSSKRNGVVFKNFETSQDMSANVIDIFPVFTPNVCKTGTNQKKTKKKTLNKIGSCQINAIEKFGETMEIFFSDQWLNSPNDLLNTCYGAFSIKLYVVILKKTKNFLPNLSCCSQFERKHALSHCCTDAFFHWVFWWCRLHCQHL